MLDMYKIEGSINLDTHPCLDNLETYPQFEKELQEFKDLLIELVDHNQSKTFY